MLQNEAALEVAERELLKNMADLCGRREYVAYMRPLVEMHSVLEEVQERLNAENEDEIVLNEAGRVWENLLTTATRELGIGMHLLIPGCVKIVAEYCQGKMQRTVITPHLLRGLVALLQSDPEQAVAPLTRHGRPILSFCMKGYAQAKTDRPARNEYILAHL